MKFLSAFFLVTYWGISVGATAELSRADKLRALYSDQFGFDRDNTPLITIAINDGLSSVEISSVKPIRVLPDGADGSQLIAGKRWRITLKKGTPAKLEYFVVLTEAAPGQMKMMQLAAARWESSGITTRMLEVGSVFGTQGQVFDNRQFLLAEGPFASSAAAERRADEHIKEGRLEKRDIVPQLTERPVGDLEAIDLDTGARLIVKDAIWFESNSEKDYLEVFDRAGTKRHYRGQIYVALDHSGKLAIVNALPADQLLAGLVPAEIFPSAPDTALQAQAVAARGNLLSKIGHLRLADPFLTCAWEQCQVYRGVDYENPRATQAVNTTRGLVLMRREEKTIVNALYHAESGGFTESNENVWFGAPDPALRGHLDAPPGALREFASGITESNIRRWLTMTPDTWSVKSGFNKDKLRWRIKKSVEQVTEEAKDLKLGRITALRMLKRGISGRGYLLEVEGVLGKVNVQGELKIRRLFGNLPSSMFIVDPVYGANKQIIAFEFIGGGWGHGSGLCQTGAVGMSKAGKSFRDILQHYYLNSEVQKIY